MYLVHIAVGTLAAIGGYILGIYFPLMPMQALVLGGLLYHSTIAQYKHRRAAELQAILDAQPTPTPEVLDTSAVSPELAAAFERMQAQ